MLLHDSTAHGLTFLSPRTPHPLLAFALLMLKKYYLSVYLSLALCVSVAHSSNFVKMLISLNSECKKLLLRVRINSGVACVRSPFAWLLMPDL
jgi:hypothetical protein